MISSKIFLVLALVFILAAVWGDFGFYAPLHGKTAVGSEPKITAVRSRDTAIVEVKPYMTSVSGQAPTLLDVIRFFGLEDDTLPCTVALNDGELPSTQLIEVRARQARSIGSEVTLCLNG